VRSHLHPNRFSSFLVFSEHNFLLISFAKHGKPNNNGLIRLLIGLWIKWLRVIILYFNALQAFTYKETYTKSKFKLLSFHKIFIREGRNLPVTTHEVFTRSFFHLSHSVLARSGDNRQKIHLCYF
jgi:hypothetical protein